MKFDWRGILRRGRKLTLKDVEVAAASLPEPTAEYAKALLTGAEVLAGMKDPRAQVLSTIDGALEPIAKGIESTNERVDRLEEDLKTAEISYKAQLARLRAQRERLEAELTGQIADLRKEVFGLRAHQARLEDVRAVFTERGGKGAGGGGN